MIQNKKGLIIYFSSVATIINEVGTSIYSSSKSGLETFSQTIKQELDKFNIKVAKDGIKRTAFHILSREGVTFDNIRSIWPELPNASRDEEEQLEISAHYSGYLEKQEADIIAFRKDENLLIPENIDYDKLSGLSNEVKSKFSLIKPKTLGQALRIDGITPAAVYILLSHVKRGHQKFQRA